MLGMEFWTSFTTERGAMQASLQRIIMIKAVSKKMNLVLVCSDEARKTLGI